MNRTVRFSGKLSFALFIALIVAMIIASFVEKAKGSEYVYTHFYGSAWFIACWATLVIYGSIYLIAQGVYKRIINFCLHLSLVLILVGALVTHISSQNGVMRLREGVPNHFFQDNERGVSVFPFVLKLISFDIEYYAGTQAPANYVSLVEVNDPLNGKKFEAKISMNNILTYEGYRFYQSSFDDDMQGSVLSVSRDVYGIPITYAGYYLLFISMLLMLFDKRGRFRALLRNPLLKQIPLTIALLLAVSLASNASPAPDSCTISRAQAERLGKTWMLYEGRVVPLQTFARDFTAKLTGKPTYKPYSAEQFMAGWLLFPEIWRSMPIFNIGDSELQKIIGKKEASFADFFENNGSTSLYKLSPYLKDIYKKGKQTAFIKEAAKLDEKIQIIHMLWQGGLLAVFPYNNGERVQWFSPTDPELQPLLSPADSVFVADFFTQYSSNVKDKNAEQTNLLLDKLEAFQQLHASSSLPSDTHRKVELLYNNANIFPWLFKICLTLGLLSLILFIWQTIKNIPESNINMLFSTLLFIAFLAQTTGIGMRYYIGGRLPLGNGFETMLFIAWCALLIALCLRRYSPIRLPFGFLISGFALLVAHLGAMNPKIGNLVPVLSSPLLSAHVSVIMFAYALAGFMTLNSLVSFLILIFGNKRNAATLQTAVNKLRLLSELFLYPCAFLLATGIFIGAIWANVSWGRYWGWDPKEVWALVTFLIAVLPFHSKTLTWFRNTFFFNTYILLIFASILMTYFGVNYFLGGMHSYAGNADMGNVFIIIFITLSMLAGLITIAYQRYKRIYKKEDSAI